MKLTFITDEATQSPTEFIALAKRFEIDSLELRTVADKHISFFDAAERAELRQRLSDDNLGVCCISSSVFKGEIRANIEPELDKLRRAIDAAQFFGAGLVRIFTFWRSEDRTHHHARIVECLRQAEAIARPSGIVLGIENGKRTMHSSGAELAALLEELDSPSFSAVWDPGNSLLGGTDPDPIANGYPAILPHLGHVHIKDPQFHADGSRAYVAVGSGRLGIERQIEQLARDGYQGYISLETHWRPDRVMSHDELDFPGGEAFSASGYAATLADLKRLEEMINHATAATRQDIGALP